MPPTPKHRRAYSTFFIGRGNSDDKANTSDNCGGRDVVAALLPPVGDEAECEHTNEGDTVDGGDHELSGIAFVAELCNGGGDEVLDGLGSGCKHVHNDEYSGAPVTESHLHRLIMTGLVATGASVADTVSETLNNQKLLFGSEPFSSAGPVKKNHPRNEG